MSLSLIVHSFLGTFAQYCTTIHKYNQPKIFWQSWVWIHIRLDSWIWAFRKNCPAVVPSSSVHGLWPQVYPKWSRKCHVIRSTKRPTLQSILGPRPKKDPLHSCMETIQRRETTTLQGSLSWFLFRARHLVCHQIHNAVQTFSARRSRAWESNESSWQEAKIDNKRIFDNKQLLHNADLQWRPEIIWSDHSELGQSYQPCLRTVALYGSVTTGSIMVWLANVDFLSLGVRESGALFIVCGRRFLRFAMTSVFTVNHLGSIVCACIGYTVLPFLLSSC
jgi:hypothetical protein